MTIDEQKLNDAEKNFGKKLKRLTVIPKAENDGSEDSDEFDLDCRNFAL